MQARSVVPGDDARVLADADHVEERGDQAVHVDELHLVTGDSIVDTVPTYRGEGKVFL